MTFKVCSNPNHSTILWKNRWITYCFLRSLVCLWGKAPLGLAAGHTDLVAHWQQCCLADENIIHVAPWLCYNMLPQLHAWGQNCCVTDSFPTFGETLCLPGQMLGNNLFYQKDLCRPFAPRPLLPMDLSEQATCASACWQHGSLPVKQRVHAQQLWSWSTVVSLGAQITFRIVAPGYWLV